MRPTEVKLVAQILDSEASDEAREMAKEIIEVIDKSRTNLEQWVLSFKVSAKSPVITVGPWTTKNQALKATKLICFDDDPMTTPGVGWYVHKMNTPTWLASL